jgi:hypothetical protein
MVAHGQLHFYLKNARSTESCGPLAHDCYREEQWEAPRNTSVTKYGIAAMMADGQHWTETARWSKRGQ